MKQILSKIWFRILAGMLALLLLGGLGLYFYATPERVQGLMVSALSDRFGRPVAVEEMHLSPDGTLEAVGLRVWDRPEFGETPFLSIPHASMSLRPWSFFSGHLEGGYLVLNGPKVSVVVDEDGRSNYADLWAGEKGLLPVTQVAISEGGVRYEDRRKGAVTAFEGINYQAHMGLEDDRVRFGGELWVGEGAALKGEGMAVNGLRVTHQLLASRQDVRTGKRILDWLRVLSGEIRLRAERLDAFQDVYGTLSPSKFSGITLRKGDQVRIVFPGGGGYGRPTERNREAVQEDVRVGFVSREKAALEYGYEPD